MPSYAPVQTSEPRLVDTFERTANPDVRAFSETFRQNLSLSTSRSQVLAMRNSFEELERTLSQLASAPDNWNSYGSPAPTPKAIESARRILRTLEPERLAPRRVLLSADGGIALVFMSSSDNRAVIETLNSGDEYLLLYDKKGSSKTLDWDQLSTGAHELLTALSDHIIGGKSLAAS